MSPTYRGAFSLTSLLVLMVLSGCQSEADSTPPASARPVFATRVQAAAQHEAAYTGVVAARTESDLGFRVGGKIVERRVDPGDRVKRGDTLLVLDIEDFELALRAAHNRVQAAEAQVRQARDDVARYGKLVERGFMSRRTLDVANTDLHVASAELAAASAEARQVENRRGYSTLKADGDGIVTEVRVDRGQVVGEGQVVARLAHDGAREVVVDIPENQRGLASGSAQAFPFGEPQHGVPARLRELSAAADPTTRTYRARYILDGAAERFALGSTITLRLGGAGPSTYSRVPIGALHDIGKGSGVWLIDADDTVRFTPVQVASLGQEQALLSAGVQPGQRVVALGAHLLHAGDKVRPRDEPGTTLVERR